MNARTINSIAQQIHHRFPEVAGQQPSVRTQAGAKAPGRATYLLTFKSQAKSAGPLLPRTVRVVADESGHILKITTSR
jgi:hypothetical protein